MIFCAFNGVRNHGACFHDKGPVAGLGKEEFAGGLPQSTIQKRVGGGVAEATCEFNHANGRHMKVRVNPGVGALQPDGPVPFVAP